MLPQSEKTAMIYSTLDLTIPCIPQRSCLYSIPPVGAGTPYVECLTSYLCRLAATHSVSFGSLYERLLIPSLKKAYLTTPLHLSPASTLTGSFRNRMKNINGVGKLSKEWTATVESLTLRHDIRSMSLTALSTVIPHWELLRPFQAWCPACYEQMLHTEHTIYQPLLWTFNAVDICPRHVRSLIEHCPYCHRLLLPLTRRAQLGYCSRCGHWLGEHQYVQSTATASISVEAQRWKVFVANCVGDLLVGLANMNNTPTKKTIMESLRLCIAISAGGVITQFAKLIGSTTATVSGWCRGEIKVPLGSLLKICYCLDLSIMDFLRGADAVRKSRINVKELLNAVRVVRSTRTPRPFDRRKAETELATFLNVVPPVSMAEAARRMRTDQKHLYLKFPELCRKIASRYKEYLQGFYKTERVRREEEVRQAVIHLHSQGIYASPRPVAEYLNKPTYLGRRDVAIIIRETREQLDSEKGQLANN
jgi:hypothetical protein